MTYVHSLPCTNKAESGPYLRNSSRVPRRCVYIAYSEKSECSSNRSTFSSRPRAGSSTVYQYAECEEQIIFAAYDHLWDAQKV